LRWIKRRRSDASHESLVDACDPIALPGRHLMRRTRRLNRFDVARANHVALHGQSHAGKACSEARFKPALRLLNVK
jgi:hypothetical protein